MSVTINGTSGVTFNDASSQNTAATGFGFKNRIINGAMVIDQRNAGASVTINSNAYTFSVDRWAGFGQATDGVYTLQRSTTAPTGFVNSLLATVTTADASIGASQFYILRHTIEGFNCADLNWGATAASEGKTAATVTLSFWVRSSLTGTFSGSVTNSAYNRSYPFTFTINAANTYEYKTVTISGDTSGTWVTDNGLGISLYFDLGSGSSNKGTAGAWAGSGLVGATGSVNLIATNGATFYITGVQLEKGSTATSFDYRPYGTELQLAQRYYFKISGGSGSRLAVGHNLSTVGALCSLSFPVTMRTAPTALETSGTAGDYDIQYLATATTCSAVPTFNAASQYIGSVAFIVASGLTAGQGSNGRSVNTTAYLGWSAEL
jgi:hypothetical protein